MTHLKNPKCMKTINYNDILIDCRHTSMVGDGYCNDEANIPECEYDGGDCCGPCIVTDYCFECECLNTFNYDFGLSSTINPLIRNGFCNDETNNENCFFDGGDCCGPCVVKLHCSECQCLSDETICNPIFYRFLRDGKCHDLLNIAACNFDGGDCCGPNVDRRFCTECACLNENYSCLSEKDMIFWGDAFCHDEFNTPGCGFDGGDCCGPNVQERYCSQCKCFQEMDQIGGWNVTDDSLLWKAYNLWIYYSHYQSYPLNPLLADGFCNDELNNRACDYDGFDCCTSQEYLRTEFCTECICQGKILKYII